MDDQNLYHVLVTHPTNQAILSLKDGQLPVIRFEGCITTHLIELCQLVQREIGCDFRLIRLRNECEMSFKTRMNYETYWPILLIFEIPDNQEPAAPKGYVWIPKDETQIILVEPPRPCVIDYLQQYRSKGLDTNGNRLFPYSRAGWYDFACVWIKEELGRFGIKVECITQLRGGEDSCMLLVTSTYGLKFYMKAVTPGGWYEEVKVTRELGHVMSEEFPKPLSYDLAKGWLLMQDYGETLGFEAFSAQHNPELMQHVLSKWAKIQKKSISLTDELVRLGVPTFDGKRLKHDLLEVLEDPEWFEAQREGMKDDEKQRYSDWHEYKHEYIRYVDRLLRKVSDFKVPLTLVHGDLNTVNVIKNDESDYVFMDLFCSCISFPFLDVLNFARDLRGGDVGNLDFYLKFWTEYESIERLRELMFIIYDVYLVTIQIDNYLRFSISEESGRLRSRMEMRFPVIRAFKKYRENTSEDE